MRGNIWFGGVEGIRGLLTQLTALSLCQHHPFSSLSLRQLPVYLSRRHPGQGPVIKNGDGRGSSSAEQVSRHCFQTVLYYFFSRNAQQLYKWFCPTFCFKQCSTDKGNQLKFKKLKKTNLSYQMVKIHLSVLAQKLCTDVAFIQRLCSSARLCS